MQSFGTGRAEYTVGHTEATLLDYKLSPNAQWGAITFFWITGLPLNDNSNQCGVDFALWRFYLDGDTKPTVGPLVTSQAALVGQNDPSAPWDNDFFGKNAGYGGWHINLLIPFSKSVKVTVQLPSFIPESPGTSFVMVRGVENIPLQIGGIPLPSTARLQAVMQTSISLPVLSFHELVKIDNKKGILVGTMIDIQTLDNGSLNSLEGCWHAYLPGQYDKFPGLILGTGSEDYPESAYYFNAGPYRGPTSGLTVYAPSQNGSNNGISKISFYKIHHRDPIFFDNGFRFEWRNGDVTDPATGEKCTQITGDTIGTPGISNVSTLVYMYTFN